MSAGLVVSFDFELGWGMLDTPAWRVRERAGLYRRMRPALAELFAFLKAREIPTTWATVSSMALDAPSEVALDHLPQQYRDAVAAFLKEAEWETRCARDLLDAWHESVARFSELGSHTSTHVYAACPGVTENAYVHDVELSLQHLESAYGGRVQSLVFTRDQDAHRDAVAHLRPLNMRLAPGVYADPASSLLRRLGRGAARFWRAAPPSRVARGAHGECLQTGSLYYAWAGGAFPRAKRLQLRLQSARLLRQAASGEAIHHVWLHPYNLAESPALWEQFRRFLARAASLRDAGRLEIMTMQGCRTRVLGSA